MWEWSASFSASATSPSARSSRTPVSWTSCPGFGGFWGGKGPLSDAILGGTPIGPNNDFGPARYLEPEEVSAVATALEPVDRPRLLRHWPPWFLPRWRLYYVGSYGEAEAEAVAFEFSELRDYYLTARANGEGMILKIA